MSRSDVHNQAHPEDLLEAYSLDALDDLEALQVESHLAGCERCRLEVARLRHAVSYLGQSVAPRPAPATVLLRLRRALGPPAAPRRTLWDNPIWRWYRTPVARYLVPSAAAVVVALFSLAVVMNVGLSNRTGDLERENSTLTAQIATSAEHDSEMTETVQQLQMASQWLANPDNLSMNLTPPDGSGDSSGILVVDSDGGKAMLLLAGMEGSGEPADYEVWLMRGDDKELAGTLQVDAEGWGAVTIEPAESVYSFDRVGLMEEMESSSGARASIMVLEGAISSPVGSPMYRVQAPVWR